jgi:hypothetical protein
MISINHNQPSFLGGRDESITSFVRLGSTIENKHEHPQGFVKMLPVGDGPAFEQVIRRVSRAEDQIMVARTTVNLNRNWNGPINIGHQNPSASCGNVDMGFSRRRNEGPANIVRLGIIVKRLQACESCAGHRRAILDRPLRGEHLDGVVGISYDPVPTVASEPEFHGAEAHSSSGGHNAVPHANHPTQRITLGLVPVEVSA